MKKLVSVCVWIFAMGFVPFCSAAEFGTPDEAVALVHKVIAYIKANGQEKTFAEINNPASKMFVDRDMYVVISQPDGKNLAHGGNRKMIGLNLIELKDSDGKFFTKEINNLMETKGSGWVDFKWPNPVTKALQHKSAYFEKFGNLYIGCGIYK